MKTRSLPAALSLSVLTLVVAGLLVLAPRGRTGTPVLEEPGADREEPGGKRPSESGWIQRTYPYFKADPEAYNLALAASKRLRMAHKDADTGVWDFAGPTNIGGRITDLALHPSRPNTLLAAAATGGLFRSTDLGQTWEPLFDDQPFLSMGDIAIAPSDPDVIYVGTGEANGGHNNYAGGGLYRSVDGGQSWEYRGLAETVSIGRVLVHPDDPDRAWVAGVGSYFAPNPERGLYRTTDGGQSWERTLFVNDSTGVLDLAMRADNPDVLFASTWQRVRRVTGSYLYGRGSGVYRSTDGGGTWEELGPERGLPNWEDHLDNQGRARIGRIGLAVSESDPDVVYAYYTNGSGFLGLFRSNDGGDTWVDAHPSRSIGGGNSFGFSWYFGQVRVDPTDANRVFVLDVSIFRSVDGGATFQSRSGTHVDHHAMLFHPQNPSAVIEGNDGGVSLSLDGGLSWDRMAPLPITQFYEISLDPVRPQRLFGGSQDNGTVGTSSGSADDWKQIFGGDGFYSFADPQFSSRIWASSQWGNLVAVDGAFTSVPQYGLKSIGSGIPELAQERRNFATPIVPDPYDARIIYYGTYRIWRTQDAVATEWQPISGDLTRGADVERLGTISTIGVSTADPSVIWVGTDDGKAWVSSDRGSSWNDVTGALPLRWITRVLPDPVDPATAYVTFSGLKWRDPTPHVFRTRNLGQTWEDITADLPDAPVNAIAVDPENPDHLFVGTDIGMFASLNDGLSWQPLDGGLPAVTIGDLKIDESGRRLVAGTHGRGIYTFALAQLDSDPTDSGDPVTPVAFSVGAPYPNPFTDRTRVHVEGSIRGALVYDITGRIVAMPRVTPVGGSTSVVEWDGATRSGEPAASGSYLLMVSGSRGQKTVPVVRVR